VQRAVCNVQCATCNLQRAVCNVQCAECNVQCAVCNMQRAVCNVQCATHSVQRATHSVRRATYRVYRVCCATCTGGMHAPHAARPPSMRGRAGLAQRMVRACTLHVMPQATALRQTCGHVRSGTVSTRLRRYASLLAAQLAAVRAALLREDRTLTADALPIVVGETVPTRSIAPSVRTRSTPCSWSTIEPFPK
jgi:hypothetical protein